MKIKDKQTMRSVCADIGNSCRFYGDICMEIDSK